MRQITAHRIAEGAGDALGGARGLRFAAQEPRDGHAREARRAGEVDAHPALERHIAHDSLDVIPRPGFVCSHDGHSLHTCIHRVNAIFNVESLAFMKVGYGGHMPRRPILRAPAFGQWLAEKRAHESYESIARRLRPHVKVAGVALDRSGVKKFEGGRIPNWAVLHAFSQVYKEPIVPLVERLVRAIVILRGPGQEVVPLVVNRDAPDAEFHQPEPTGQDTTRQQRRHQKGVTLARGAAHADSIPWPEVAKISVGEFFAFYQDIRAAEQDARTRSAQHRSVSSARLKSPKSRKASA